MQDKDLGGRARALGNVRTRRSHVRNANAQLPRGMACHDLVGLRVKQGKFWEPRVYLCIYLPVHEINRGVLMLASIMRFLRATN